MSTIMSLLLAVILLMLGISAPLEAYLDPEFPLASQGNAGGAACGPPLTETQLRDIVRRAIRVTGGDPTNLDRDFRLSIHQSGCDYIVLGVRQPETIPQEFAITIDRSGRVKSWPWCCVPEFEIGPLEDREASDPPIIITDAEGRHWPLDPSAPTATQASEPQVSEEPAPQALPLSSLRPECHLSRQWVGSVFDLPWGTWLRCADGEPMLVTHPRNLLGKVQIQSMAQALEFVRFFSSPHRHEMFNLDGILEITDSEEDWGQNVLKFLPINEQFHPPRVTSRTATGYCYRPEGEFHECKLTEYSIERIAAFYDNNIYKILETVTADGFYTLCSREILLEDIGQFGLLHLPPH